MALPRNAEVHLRNADYTDRELLHVISDLQAGSGWVTTLEVVERLALPEGGGHAVATRLSWMVRYGWLERNEEARGRWRLTRKGRALMSGKLSPETQAALEAMSHGDRVLVMREVAKRSMVSADAPTADMLRREYLHHEAARKSRRGTR